MVLRGEVRVATQPCGAVLLWWRNTQSMEAAQRTGSLSLKCGTRNTQPRTTWWRSTPMAVAVYVPCDATALLARSNSHSVCFQTPAAPMLVVLVGPRVWLCLGVLSAMFMHMFVGLWFWLWYHLLGRGCWRLVWYCIVSCYAVLRCRWCFGVLGLHVNAFHGVQLAAQAPNEWESYHEDEYFADLLAAFTRYSWVYAGCPPGAPCCLPSPPPVCCAVSLVALPVALPVAVCVL